MSETSHCPDCGTELPPDPWSEGLCPQCLLELALDSPSLEAQLEADPEEAPTLSYAPEQTFAEGEIHGERYRMRALLGRGGMGEVWRAYDLKLRQDVALKALRGELIQDRRALETLRQEVRVAREVISPNVCRVFDLQELDGQELVSMEYVDGVTLQQILRERSPLGLNEAREFAAQFLAGLEAIHEAGLVHRDIKPENVMVTRTGRVVVMDLGIAQSRQDAQSGVIAGTPAYMSPEQSQGGEVDARSDLFAAGVVLAEMVAPGGVRSVAERERVWRGIHQAIPRIEETPWARSIARAVSPERGERFASANALARALEEVTLRAAGEEDVDPYPGLASFTEEQAKYFYGRELEVEALWKKLRRPHLVALIAPSGSGKSSFLRAGLLPTLPEDWSAILVTPGARPFTALARAVAEKLDGEGEPIDALPRCEEGEAAIGLISRWRRAHKEALVIVDQFEELFTQNPGEVQSRLAELLGRLPLEADTFVLLSMREDFLYHCQPFEALAPVFTELMPLGALSGSSLRRALVQPALKCGYRFEDDTLVDEMVEAVSHERGALPLLAFAASRLWSLRDRDQGLLTRETYERIGGVGGALAQHAEATLEEIGPDRIPIVRELLRNLVTAQGTRAARDRDELLSVFSTEPKGSVPSAGESESAEVLDTLIDARLLTSYELPAADDRGDAHQHIEIVHESLLTAWPRLVRWRIQDQEGARLRDELRHQARVWRERNRPDDLLWTGTSYREFALWRERYPGGLTAAEEEFSRAMTARAERRRRLRRLAVASAFGVLVVVLGVIAFFGWQAELARDRAEAEARRAEASKLLALAQLRQQEDSTEALAYTTASLALDDGEEARLFALRLLWEAPPALELAPGGTLNIHVAFSPEGRQLAASGGSDEVRVWSEEAADRPVVLPALEASSQEGVPRGGFRAAWASEELLVVGTVGSPSDVSVWRLPEGEQVRTIDFGGPSDWQVGAGLLLVETLEDAPDRRLVRQRLWPLPNGDPRELGRVDWSALGASLSLFLPNGEGWLYVKGKEIYLRPLPASEGRRDRLLGHHSTKVVWIWPLRENSLLIYSLDESAEARVWDLSEPEPALARVIPSWKPTPESSSPWRIPGPSLRWALGEGAQERERRLWNLAAWPEARPLTLRRSGSWFVAPVRFHPLATCVVVSTQAGERLTFWPLEETRPWVVDGYSFPVRPLAFSPDSRWLATTWGPMDARSYGETLRLWPLPDSDSREVRRLKLPELGGWNRLVFDPQGRFLFVVETRDRAAVVPLDGSPPRQLEHFSDQANLSGAAVSPSGRRVATAFSGGRGEKTLRVWDLETGELRLFDLPEGSISEAAFARGIEDLAFAGESTLYTAGDGGVRRWDLESGEHELVLATRPGHGIGMAVDAAGRTALVIEGPVGKVQGWGPARILDLGSGAVRSVPAFGEPVAGAIALDPSGRVAATGDREGIVRVGELDGEEPHLLIGHEGPIDFLAISPDLRWVASTGEDDTLRLWPMPDLAQPALHTLSHDAFMAQLRSLTNLRSVRDPDSEGGWKIELDPFPGWKDLPSWAKRSRPASR